MVEVVQVRVGDVVKMKKGHPCGTNEWEIIKLGMDVGIKCLGCGREVRLLRSKFDQRFRGYINRADGGSKWGLL